MTPTIIQNVRPRHRSVSSQWHRGLRAQRGSINSTTATIALGITIILSVATLSFFYLSQVQDTASQGSDIQNLEERLMELHEQQRSIELESAQLRSIQTIEERVPELNLVATDRVTYLSEPFNRVAARNN